MTSEPARVAKAHLRGLTPPALTALCPEVSLEPRLARRILSRVVGSYRDTLDGIPGLSRPVAAALERHTRLSRLRVVDIRASAVDPFAKFLFEAGDGVRFEAVRIPLERPRWSVCLSSQAGCALGCRFCATGRMGLARDLETWEMVEQVLAVRAASPERPVTGVVFQGQGEPFLNYDRVLAAIDVLRDPCGGRIGSDRISLSTVGLPAQIERYTDEGHPYRLILSLTSTRDDRRTLLIPTARAHSVGDIAQAMRRHARRVRGVVHLAWVLIRGLNTGPEEALGLAQLFPDVPLRVSLIDVNDPSGTYHAPEADELKGFIDALAARGIAFVRRYSGGSDILAACGTLASTACGGRALCTTLTPPEGG